MACGSYHSLVVANDVNRIMKKDYVRTIKESLNRYDSQWNCKFCKLNGKQESRISEFALNSVENMNPSEEGTIDNP